MSATKRITIRLHYDEWEQVIAALKSPDGNGNEIDDDLVTARDVTLQLQNHCPKGPKHKMIQPERGLLKWGDYGICETCHTVRPMGDGHG